MKAKFRAWMIDLVREAIRSEFPAIRGSVERVVTAKGEVPAVAYIDPDNPKTHTPKSYTDALDRALNPSFEQMQAEALKAQEKYYEPA